MDVFRHLHMPPELAHEFLGVFSRMEYALKATGTYAMKGSGKSAAANWDRFANTINDPFRAIADEGFKAAVDYILTRPPRKQIYENGVVRFEDQTINKSKKKTAQQTLLMIRTVRNNLFHGGKHIPGDEQEPGRNEALVSYSLIILKACAPLEESVRFNYEH